MTASMDEEGADHGKYAMGGSRCSRQGVRELKGGKSRSGSCTPWRALP
jgi:hypothetical protein